MSTKQTKAWPTKKTAESSGTNLCSETKLKHKMTFPPFLLASTCCPRIARVAPSEELGTMSRNNMKWKIKLLKNMLI